MQEHQSDPASSHANGVGDLATLRVTCRRQAEAIETMSRLIAELGLGMHALRSEIVTLHAVRRKRWERPGEGNRPWGSEGSIEICLPLDATAPAAARMIVAGVLSERVSALVLEGAKLVISELVTNSVQHSGGPVDHALLVRMGLISGGFWLEVEDSGHEGFVAPRAPAEQASGGRGLRLVETLSERWGMERASDRGTRVWAEFATILSPAKPYHRDETQALSDHAAATDGKGNTVPKRLL